MITVVVAALDSDVDPVIADEEASSEKSRRRDFSRRAVDTRKREPGVQGILDA